MSRFYPLSVSQVTKETREAVSISFIVPLELKPLFQYVQGQHITLRTTVEGEDIRRSYSICSAVQDDELRIAIKRIPGGIFSNWANEHLVPGLTVEVMPPAGHFNVALSPENEKHYVAFAAGSGITPIISVIKTTLITEPRSRFTLFYGNRASSAVIFKEALEDLKDAYLSRFNLVFLLSREQQDIDLFNGRIDRAKCEALFAHWLAPSDIDTAFICGPRGMMEDVSGALEAHGLEKSQIKMELFATSLTATSRPPVARPVAGQNECEVCIIQDGRQHHFSLEKNTETVLDAALRNGMALPYSCKGGVCSTCRAKLLEGEVDMDANFALEDYEVARGFILTCQSYPVTDRIIVDFDQAT